MLFTKKGKKLLGRVFSAVGLAVGAAILVYLVHRIRATADIGAVLAAVRPVWLAGAVLCVPVAQCIDALIFYLMGRGSGCPVRLGGCFDAVFIGEFYYKLGPAGAPVQLGLMYKAGMPAAVTASVYTWKMVANTLVYTGYAVAALVFKLVIRRESMGPAAVGVGVLIGLYVGLCTLALFFIRRPAPMTRLIRHLLTALSRPVKALAREGRVDAAMGRVEEFGARLRALKDKRRVLAGLYAGMFLELTALFAIPFFLYRGLGLSGVGFWELVLTQCLVMVLSRLVLLPGNAGGAEGSFYLFMAPIFGWTLPVGLVLWRCAAFLEVLLLGGLWSVFRFVRNSLRPAAGGEEASV